MKKIILILSLCFGNSVFAETIVVDTELKSEAIIKLLDNSLTVTFEAHSNELFSSFDGIIKTPRIVELVKQDNRVTQIIVALLTSFSTFDYDFGDPVDELIETSCEATLVKGNNGLYSEDLTTVECDVDPQDYLY